jgi:hypothetical protein
MSTNVNAHDLTSDDCRFILTSLEFTQHKFEDYDYQDAKLKRQRIQDVRDVIMKVRALRDELKASEKGVRGK